MAIRGKDVAATVLTALAVLVYFTVREGWDVWLIGDSVRWATGAVLVLGAIGCGMGAPAKDSASVISGVLGVAALVFGVGALVTGSLTWLGLLVATVVALWAVSTFHHVWLATHHHPPGAPAAT